MSQDSVFIHAFGFSGYRSFIQSATDIGPLGKVNLLAGQNNAGKSNVLRFLDRHLAEATLPPSVEMDRPQNVLPQDWKLRLRLFTADFVLPENVNAGNAIVQQTLAALRSSQMAGASGFGFQYVLSAAESYRGGRPDWRRWVLDPEFVAGIAGHLRNQNVNLIAAVNAVSSQNYVSGSDNLRFTTELLTALAPDLSKLPKVRIIQAFRQIRPRESEDDSEIGLFDGVGLVQRLQQLESPTEIGTSRDELRAKYERINAFVRHILDDQSATLHIPYDASTVQIARGSTVLPLESLGTGVHQVVMLAAAATLLNSTLIGLEEPEVHLHPLLQRRLVKYLADETDNQYLIATHSAHLLDYEAGKVFHLTYTDAGTDVTPAGTPHDVARVCADLGYRPSDLLQSNCIIWVEGPSDRIYLRCWIRLIAPKLIEGVHYSVMFYGGGLLRHLTPDDPRNPGLAIQYHEEAISDFISLRALNRHLVVVIDSDKTSNRKPLNPTKTRVRRAFEEGTGPGFAWITDGYTIENYVPRQLLGDAVAAVHPKWRLLPDEGQWANPLRFQGNHKADKVAIARFVSEKWTREALKAQRLERPIRSLVDVIHTANGYARYKDRATV